MKRKAYPTDLSDKEWELLELLIPPAKPGGRPREADMREIVNAIVYQLRSGGAWRLLPHDFPNWSTVYGYFNRWSKDGTDRKSTRLNSSHGYISYAGYWLFIIAR